MHGDMGATSAFRGECQEASMLSPAVRRPLRIACNRDRSGTLWKWNVRTCSAVCGCGASSVRPGLCKASGSHAAVLRSGRCINV